MDELADDAVDALGVASQRDAAAFTTLGRVDQLGACLVERRRQTEPQKSRIAVFAFNRGHRDTYGHKDTSLRYLEIYRSRDL